MDSWNGMTEPLGVGDRVRIVWCQATLAQPDPARMIGIVSTVARTHEDIHGCDGTVRGQSYELDAVPGQAYHRKCLYKLPPDWDNVLNSEPTRVPEEA